MTKWNYTLIIDKTIDKRASVYSFAQNHWQKCQKQTLYYQETKVIIRWMQGFGYGLVQEDDL